MKKVNVILPAYNGEKYIGEQIESLFSQTYRNVDIYIRDDNSSDHTVDIIKSYIGLEPEGKRIILIDDEKTNWGYVRNVFDTWKLTASADYYCFCDQDDVWHNEKIEKSIALLESKGPELPALCFTGFNYCDSELYFVRKSDSVPKELCLQNVCYDFLALNFNITVNHAFRKVFFANLQNDGKYPNYPDLWMSRIAACYKRLYYMDEPLVEYRRQDQAASYANHNPISLFFWRFKLFFMKNESLKIKKDLRDFYYAFSGVMSESDKQMMSIFTQDSFVHYFQKIFYLSRLRRKIPEEFALRFMFILGML